MSENNNNKKDNKEKDSSNIENKSKAALLSRGINSISHINKYSIFNKNQIIKRKDSFYEKKKCLENNGIRKIKFIPLFYPFFQNNEDINLFNLSMSLYKKKMDIIYLFHIILVFEKLLELEKEKIMNNKEIMINLKEIEFCS